MSKSDPEVNVRHRSGLVWLYSAVAFAVVWFADLVPALAVAGLNSYSSLRSPTLDAVFAILTFPVGILYPLDRAYLQPSWMMLVNPTIWAFAAAAVTVLEMRRTWGHGASPTRGSWSNPSNSRIKIATAGYAAVTIVMFLVGRSMLFALSGSVWVVTTVLLGPISFVPLSQSAPGLPQLITMIGMFLVATLLLAGALFLTRTRSRIVRLIAFVSAILTWLGCGSLTALIYSGA